MDNKKIAKELMKVAKELVAESNPYLEDDDLHYELLEEIDGKRIGKYKVELEESVGSLMIYGDDEISLGCTPFWEDSPKGITIELSNDGGLIDHFEVKFPVTGNVKKDARKYLQIMNVVIKRLKAFK